MIVRYVKLVLFAAICILIIPCEAYALSKIIVVPTGRTIGTGRYSLEIERRGPFFNAPSANFNLTQKFGFGQRFQLEAKEPLGGSSSAPLFFAKYTFIATHAMRTVAAMGVENVSSNRKPSYYLVGSHLFKPIDLSVGIAIGEDAIVRYLIGVDCLISKHMHILSDYNTGDGDIASVGFDYRSGGQWEVKSGWVLRQDHTTDIVIKLIYNGRYD